MFKGARGEVVLSYSGEQSRDLVTGRKSATEGFTFLEKDLCPLKGEKAEGATANTVLLECPSRHPEG